MLVSHVFGEEQSVSERHWTHVAVVDGAVPVCLHTPVGAVQGTLFPQLGGTMLRQKSLNAPLQMEEEPGIPPGFVHCVA